MNKKSILAIILSTLLLLISCNNTNTTGVDDKEESNTTKNESGINEKKINPRKLENTAQQSNSDNFSIESYIANSEDIYINLKDDNTITDYRLSPLTMTIDKNGNTASAPTITFEGEEVNYLTLDGKNKYTFTDISIEGTSKQLAEQNSYIGTAVALYDVDIYSSNIELKSTSQNTYSVNIVDFPELYNKIKDGMGLIKLTLVIVPTSNSNKLKKAFPIYIRVIPVN